jgi:hypothetical protein
MRSGGLMAIYQRTQPYNVDEETGDENDEDE